MGRRVRTAAGCEPFRTTQCCLVFRCERRCAGGSILTSDSAANCAPVYPVSDTMRPVPFLILVAIFSVSIAQDPTENGNIDNSLEPKPSVRLDPYIRKALLKALTDLEENDNGTNSETTDVDPTVETEYLRTEDTTLSNEPKSEAVVLPKPKFRSYRPQDETLQEAKLEDAEPAVVDNEVKDLLEAGKEKVVLQDLDISSLAPRKPDWDLKRDVAKKLEKLERRTQKAIAELIWERLKQGSDDNLGAMVTMTNKLPDDD
ncbi:unnamed protein product, partial [Iphiclides podalirius]